MPEYLMSALLEGEWGLLPGLAPLALDGVEERRFLAADESARADADLNVKAEAASQDVLPQQPEGPGGLHVLNELGPQHPGAVVDLFPHFLDIHFCQFVMHASCLLSPRQYTTHFLQRQRESALTSRACRGIFSIANQYID